MEENMLTIVESQRALLRLVHDMLVYPGNLSPGEPWGRENRQRINAECMALDAKLEEVERAVSVGLLTRPPGGAT